MNFKPNDIINNRFKLVRSIGRGSFGEVWLCEDTVLGINLAVKIYIALDARGLEEFKNEFKNVRHLNHPNLLRPDYYDHFENSPYLVMAYCPTAVGNKVGHISEQDAWRLIKDISAGLAYLHANDTIHRDIKPDNILQTEQGTYVISDFGLSQKMRSTLRRASSRQNNSKDNMSGTVGYMAPEMFSSKPQAVKATDVWALGATIYETLTGDMPFCGQGGVMELHGAELPELPSQYGQTLGNLMQRCLAKDPWDRPTAAEINRIARSVLPEGDEDKSVAGSQSSSKKEEQLKKEIATLKSDLQKAKSGNGIIKKSKGFKIAFWVTLIVFVLTVLFLFFTIGSITEDYEDRLGNQAEMIRNAESVINDVKNVCDNGASSTDDTFSSWTSNNHSKNTTDYKDYNITGFQGDEFSLDYSVDSESYDHFTVEVTRNGNTTKIKDVSGLNKSGSVRYELPSNGDYQIRVKYKKDHSIDSGSDRAIVNNVRFRHSPIGEVNRIVKSYSPIFTPENEDVWVEEVQEVAADSVVADTIVEAAVAE